MLHSRYISRFITVCGLIATMLCCSVPAMAAILASDILVTPVAIAGLVEGGSATNRPVATFIDLNPGVLSDYSAAIHWGDGTTSVGTITSGSGGSFTVAGTHTYIDEGTYFNATDITYLPLGLLASGVDSPTPVADAPLSLVSTTFPVPFTPNVQLNNVLLATFKDANPFGAVADFTGTINWGDSTQSSAVITFGSGLFGLEGIHTYANPGTFPISILINDNGGSSLRTSTTAESSTSVPEPSSLALMTIGAIGAAWLRKRKGNA